MSISYDVFAEAFVNKVTEYGFAQLLTQDRNRIVDSYMKTACSKFKRICKYNLSDRSDILREFAIDIPEDEIDEIVDIVSEGMVEQWLKPYVYSAEKLENIMKTRDFTAYSPAELLLRARETHESVKRGFTNMMRDYSFSHGDLTDLSL